MEMCIFHFLVFVISKDILIFFRTKDIEKFGNFIQNQKDFLLELLTFIAKLNLFSTEHLQDYIVIVLDIIKLENTLSPEISMFLQDIFEKFQNFGAIRELALLCDIILER